MSRGLLDGKVSLVIGGSTGIGRAVVERFLEEGSFVSVLDLDITPLAELLDPLKENLECTFGDARESGDIQKVVEKTVQKFGTIDTLICCAGRFDFHSPIGSLSLDALASGFDEIFAVNVKSMLLSVRAAQQWLTASNGSVILTISASAFYPEGGGALYGSSKWATRGLVSHLARELAPQVRVNGVAPGGTAKTHLSGLQSLGDNRSVESVPGRENNLRSENLLSKVATPRDHAGAYLFLASYELSPFVNGAIINSDGGRGSSLGTQSNQKQLGEINV